VVDPSGRPIQSTQAPVAGLTPADLRDAYKIAGSGDRSTIIAVVAANGYDNAESDLAAYRSFFGLPPCTTESGCFRKFNQRGEEKDYPPQDLDWAQDSAIDLEMASAMCPSCTLYLVEADLNSFDNLAAAENTAATLGAHTIVNSYGGDEPNTQRFVPAYQHKGVAIVASSGDRGNIVQFPSSSPYVVAVGGTHLARNSNKRGWTESAWSDGGSGCSAIYPKPEFQHDTGCANRTTADLAAIADPFTGVAIYGPVAGGGSKWLEFGGTSVAAPIIAGIYGVNGGKVHDNREPYRHRKALFDVKSGSNGTCNPAYLCTAGKGYDGPTGLGTPNGSAAFGSSR
jgi:subtilase family serine protease